MSVEGKREMSDLLQSPQAVAEKKPNKLRQMYVQCYTSKRRWAIYAVGYIVMILIPYLYGITAKLPPESELLESSGELFFERTVKNGSFTGLRTSNGDMLFTCRNEIGGGHSCLIKKRWGSDSGIQGKTATIRWYRQPVYLWAHQNRLVELWVGNERLISREQTQNAMRSFSKLDVLGLIFFWPLIIAVDMWYKRLLKIKKEEINNG